MNEKSMKSYSEEELVAEIGACYLLSYAGIIDAQLDNSASYIQAWLKRLDNDVKFIFQASAQAQKAVDFILDLVEIEQTPEPVEAAISLGELSNSDLDDLPF
jgi:antirestriction protein ArdC